MTTPIGYQFQATTTVGQKNLTIMEGQRTEGEYQPETQYTMPAGVYTALISYSGPEELKLMCNQPSWHTSATVSAGSPNVRRQGAGVVNMTAKGRITLELPGNGTTAGYTASVTLIPQLIDA